MHDGQYRPSNNVQIITKSIAAAHAKLLEPLPSLQALRQQGQKLRVLPRQHVQLGLNTGVNKSAKEPYVWKSVTSTRRPCHDNVVSDVLEMNNFCAPLPLQ